MGKDITYHEQTDMENTQKLRDILQTLPAFCRNYFRAMEPTTSTSTRIAYAYDIRVFFRFLFGIHLCMRLCIYNADRL